MTDRWALPVNVSAAFSPDQSKRAQALRVAREVLETREASKSPFTPGATDNGVPWLLETAQWIVDGTMPDLTVFDRIEQK